MKRSHSAFLLFIIPSLTFGINFNQDTIDFTNTNNYIWLINNNSSNITIDTIVFIVDSQKTQYFNNSNLFIDTVKYNGHLFNLNYRYFVNIIGTTAFAFYRNWGNIIGINNNDSISLMHIRIQDNNYGIPEDIPHINIDTIKMTFIASDNSTDSIVAILNMCYATDVIYFKENVKLRDIKGNYPQKYYLLNGRTIDEKAIIKKYIKIIQH